MSFIYGILYLMLTGYAQIFQGVYHMNPGVGGLPYFGMVLGELIAFGVVVYINPAYVRKLKANNNIPVPEWRGKFLHIFPYEVMYQQSKLTTMVQFLLPSLVVSHSRPVCFGLVGQ